jgi:hypothetical protein
MFGILRYFKLKCNNYIYNIYKYIYVYARLELDSGVELIITSKSSFYGSSAQKYLRNRSVQYGHRDGPRYADVTTVTGAFR